METRASYVAVGSFVLFLAAGFLVFVIWLGRLSFEEAAERYLIYFTGAVTGLQEGSAVRVRGIPVGEVVDVRFDPSDIARVQVTIEVREDTPIRTDSVAQLDIQGITGIPFVQIIGGSQDAPLLEAEGEQQYPVIPSRPSTIQAVVESAPEILERSIRLLNLAEGFLSAENQRAVSETLANIAVVTGTMADQTERIEALVGNVDGLVMELRIDAARISDRLDQTLAAIDDGATTMTEQAVATAEDYRELAGAFKTTADELNAFLETARPSLNQFADTGLTEFTLMISELRQLASNLSRVTERIERDPTRFLFGGSNQGVPVQ